MKTSNKILLGFLAVLVLMPLLMLMGFRNMISNKNFSTEKYEWVGASNRAKEIKAATTIVLLSPAGSNFRCYFHYADKPGYETSDYHFSDSLDIRQQGDTLYFSFITPKTATDENGDQPSMNLTVGMPAFRSIVADRSVIILDSLPLDQSIQLNLKNDASLELGKDEDNASLYSYGPLFVTAENSAVHVQRIGKYSSLAVSLSGTSLLKMAKEVSFEKFEGNASSLSQVEGPFKLVNLLKADSTGR